MALTMMSSSTDSTITELLQAAGAGDRNAADALLPLVYEQLKVLARRQRKRWHGAQSLNTTAVVHELYLKGVARQQLSADSRAHFFASAAKAMRHILCNHARDRSRQKRGGGIEHVNIDNGKDWLAVAEISDGESDTLEALDESLTALERLAERPARVVECRFFGGMSVEETAAALGISPRTVKRDWTFARAWLRRDLEKQDS